ncbi:MBL fold metallo-hydrolase [Phenylobacterium sp. J367]|uniref:MBL fold metallo-hydrolase n=1 Tax=Phenylobacterium sp. J367 TaxID=2898435 RepID=UPI0021507AFE|nr:MBL fold metallo-hydrolase [Phenylobacterium sp. J367]MCR5878542.1 MBL fold metallo-hydrolase [Phenylobacterium sp. J367]
MKRAVAALCALTLAGPAMAPSASSQEGRLDGGSPVMAGQDQKEALHFAGGRIHQAVGFGNTFLVTTKDGNVVIDTSSAFNVTRHRDLLRAVSTAPTRAIFLTHAHPDHTGGVAAWKEAGTKVVGQANAVEFNNYQTRLAGFFAWRNAAQFGGRLGTAANPNPGNFAAPKLADTLVEKEQALKVGDLTFVAIATPGETPDHMSVWIPELKAAFVGDNYYASFPNLYTLRGTTTRYALDYVASLNRIMALEPEIVLPSHGVPIEGKAKIRETLTQYRDAIQYVHDATVAGMNQGKDVYTLMREIRLPPALEVGEGYGNLIWSIRGIYEGYAGFYDGDPATMYATPPAAAAGELVTLAGGPGPVAARAQALVATDPELALRLTSSALAVDPNHKAVLAARKAALQALLARSKNSNEAGWLRSGIARTDAALNAR